MAIVPTDIVYRYSIKTGAAGDSTASAAGTSLGKYVSTTVAAAGANGLFDDISGDENAASTVDYRCVFVLNNHATLALTGAVVYLSAEVGGGAVIAIATDNVAPSAKASATAQADLIANETTAPTAVSAFSSPVTKAAGLALGTINAGQVKAFWVRRSAANTVALNNDGVTFAVVGDTAA
jgi:hypothetical protein